MSEKPLDSLNDKEKEDYARKFNLGYALTRHLPEISAGIATANGQTPRFQAMMDGRKQYLIDQVKEKTPSWLDHRNQNKTRILGKGKDKSNEPDR